QARIVHEARAVPEASVGSARDREWRPRADPSNERAVYRVCERVHEGQPPRPREKRLLRRLPVSRVPVPLEEALRQLPHVAELVEKLYHPERPADLVPAERGRPNLLLKMPGQVERVGPVEHPEVVGLAPDDLLPARPDRERQTAELDIRVGLAQRAFELDGVARGAVHARQLEHVAREPPADGEVVQIEPPVGAPVNVFLLLEPRQEVVHAVVDAAIEKEQVRALDERDIVLVIELAALEPVVVEADVSRVPVLDELEGPGIGRPDDIL